MIDYASSKKWLKCTLKMLLLLQMIVQGSWGDDSPFRTIGADLSYDLCSQMEEAWKVSDLSTYDITPIHILEAFKNKYEEFMDFIYTFTDSGKAKKIETFLNSLPKVSVKLKLIDVEVKNEIEIDYRSEEPIVVEPDKQYFINVELNKDKLSTEAITPRFIKAKDEGWNIVLGCKDNDRLVAIKRLSPFKRSTNCKLDLEFIPFKGKSV